MCGIVGYIGHREAWPLVLSGLQHLEYRGYDSAGIAILTPSGQLQVYKSAGKVRDLSKPANGEFPKGHLGLGHTRWATHGKPTDANAHPHTDCQQQLAVVHNGIVENYLELKKRLLSAGHVFTSETDTEVIAHLIEEAMQEGRSFEEAFANASSQLEGSQAIVAAQRGKEAGKLLATRMGYAGGGVVIAHRPGEVMVGSDLPALAHFAERVSFLDHGETAVVTESGVKYLNSTGGEVNKSTRAVSVSPGWVDKSGYKHFMLKEIMEQPRVAANVLGGRVNFDQGEVNLDEIPLTEKEIRELQRVVLLGCGTSLHAAMMGKYLIEDLSGLPAEVDSCSEFRYRNFHVDEKTLVISIGQSGETADTLAAMAAVKEKGGKLITVCNVEDSQATRLAQGTLYMRAGPEIGVASTKTFIASLAVLLLTSIFLGRVRGKISDAESRQLSDDLGRLPHFLDALLEDHAPYERLAKQFYRCEHFLYLGRGTTFPIALEGALKLKEISYIHAEGYPAGEMKHGPIALIDVNMPVVVLAPDGPLYSKMVSNLKEAKTRDGVVIGVGTEGNTELASLVDQILYVPKCPQMLTPFLTVVPLQLLAYYIAVRRGCDVDQPRNLAKSVTVE